MIVPDLRIGDANVLFFFPMVDFDLPSIKVALKDMFQGLAVIIDQQIGGLTIVAGCLVRVGRVWEPKRSDVMICDERRLAKGPE